MTVLCEQEFPLTSHYYAEIGDEDATVPLIVVCGILTLLTLVDFIEKLVFCCRNFRGELWRNKVILLMALIPVISCLSLLNLTVPRATPISEFIGSAYVGFSIYLFVHLLIDYFGGKHNFIKAFDGETISFRRPPCCCCCCCSCVTKVMVTRKTNRILRFFCMQVIFIRPFTLLIGAILFSDDNYPLDALNKADRPGVYLKVIGSTSSIFAIYGLLVMYFACYRKLSYVPRLGLQFMVIKGAILFYDIQLQIMNILARTDVIKCSGVRGSYVRAYEIQAMLLILQMFIMAILARIACRHQGMTKLEVNPRNSVDIAITRASESPL